MKSREQLDAAWYPRIRQLEAATHFLHYFAGDPAQRAAAQEAFLRGDVRNPRFDYPYIASEELDDWQRQIGQLQEDLQQEPEKLVREAYIWRLGEMSEWVNLLLAAKAGDMGAFQAHVAGIYGMPKKDIFAHEAARVAALIDRGLASGSRAAQDAAKALQEVFPLHVAGEAIVRADEAVVRSVFSAVREEMKDIFVLCEGRDKWDDWEICRAFEEAFRVLGVAGWRAVVDPHAHSVAVRHAKKVVAIPRGRVASPAALGALLVHEAATHIVRADRGALSPLLLLGFGLDRYARGEEGIATVYEEAAYGKEKGLTRSGRYISLGLAAGIDGTKRDFRQVYEIMERYFLLKFLCAGELEAQAKNRAAARAWEAALRTFRGTDCATPGVCFTKDIIYKEGNLAVWRLLAEKPEELRRFSVGKYDPANERHRALLDALGVK